MKTAILLFLISTQVFADNIYINKSSIVEVYDGDTFYIDAPKAYCDMAVLCKRIGIRILGIDAPEIRGKCISEKIKANEAKEYLYMRLYSGDNIELRNVKRDKYFRIDAELFIDGVNISNEMIEKGFAVRYKGAVRSGWCKVLS